MEDGFPEQDICINGFESGSSGHSKVCSVTTVCGQSEMEEQQIEDQEELPRPGYQSVGSIAQRDVWTTE